MEAKAIRDLPVITRWADKLLELADDYIAATGGRECASDDHFAFMALNFVCKQTDHLKSIRILRDSWDALLVARSMLEGMCQLQWAALDTDQRAKRWRDFSHVHNWRVLKAQQQNGEGVDEDLLREIEREIWKNECWFVKREARELRRQGKELPPDPYYVHWTGMSVGQLFRDVERSQKYRTFYRQFSDWHHWSPGGLDRAIIEVDGAIGYRSRSPAAATQALANGVEVLLLTLDLVEQHLKLGFRERIDELCKDYLTDLERSYGWTPSAVWFPCPRRSAAG